jgi:putative Holliday junction resolvase
LSDESGTLATPAGVIRRSGDAEADRRALVARATEEAVDTVVVGLPLSLSGETGRAAEAALAEVEALRQLLSVPVVTHDERLTTVSAVRALRSSGRSTRRRPRGDVDSAAAAVLLQSWLDANRG